MNPLEEYLSQREKIAAGFMGQAMKSPTFQASVLNTGLSAAMQAIPMGVKAIHQAVTKKRDFNRMMEAPGNDDLREYQKQNPKQFNQHFTSLRNMNHTFSADPIVAGSYMRQFSDDPTYAGKALVEAAGARGPQGARFQMENIKAPQIEAPDDYRELQKQKLRGEIEMHPDRMQIQKHQLKKAPWEYQQARQQVSRGRREQADWPAKREHMRAQTDMFQRAHRPRED